MERRGETLVRETRERGLGKMNSARGWGFDLSTPRETIKSGVGRVVFWYWAWCWVLIIKKGPVGTSYHKDHFCNFPNFKD